MKQKLKDHYTVESTYDYSKFKDLLGNREDTEKRKKRVLRSIEEVGLIPAPIIINENNEVIDGQARLAAFRELNIPAYYMRVPGLTLEDCIAMNKNGTSWGMNDYINSYAQQGNKNYQILKQFRSKYKKASLDAITWTLTGTLTMLHKVKDGEFQVNYECLKDADSVLSWIEDIVDGLHIPGRVTNLQVALGYCLRDPEVDNARLKEKFRKRAFTFMSYGNISDWIKAIDDVYNFKTKSDFQVPIRARWEIEIKKQAKEDRE